MRQFANQVWQVAVVYVSQIHAWVWVLALVLFAIFSLGVLNSEEPVSVIPNAYLFAIFVSSWIVDLSRHQFAHCRAKLTPNFNLAHSAVPIGLIVIGTIGLPMIFASIGHINPLPYAVASSVAVAVFLHIKLYPKLGWFAFAIIMLAIWYSKYSDRDIDFSSILFQTAWSIPLFFLGWLGIGYYFFRICHLSEDDDVYQQLNDETQKVAADGSEGSTRAKYRNSARWWAISDRWHARIGGFHEFERTRIIRLLRYGFGATPVELAALGYAAALTVAVLFITPRPEDSYNLASSGEFVFLMLPALFASMGPIAVAGGAIGWRVPRMKNEIMFPLTRRELIDDLLLASAWHSFVIWTLGCAAGFGVLVYLLPTESAAAPLIATAALLTAATAIAAYGLSLHMVMWEVKLAQLVILGLFVLCFITLMLTWWTSRDKSGDALYWGLAFVEAGIGIMMIRTGRAAWLKLELGGQS